MPSLVLAGWCLIFGPMLCVTAQESDRQAAAQNANGVAQPRARRIRARKSAETKGGSQVSITAEGEAIKDYLSYRSGERFYVVLPKADAEGIGDAGSGRGFEDARVQKRGQDVVLSFKLQPGATARVAPQGKNLAVVFDAPAADASQTQGTNGAAALPPVPPSAANTNPLPERRESLSASGASTSARRDLPPSAKQAGSPPASVPAPLLKTNELPAPATTTTITAEPITDDASPPQASSPSASPPSTMLAQSSTAAVSSSPVVNAPAPPANSAGRNFWPWFAGALLLIAAGLFVFSRRRGIQPARAPRATTTPTLPIPSRAEPMIIPVTAQPRETEQKRDHEREPAQVSKKQEQEAGAGSNQTASVVASSSRLSPLPASTSTDTLPPHQVSASSPRTEPPPDIPLLTPVEAVRLPVAGRRIAPAEETPADTISHPPILNGDNNDERTSAPPPAPVEHLTLVRPAREDAVGIRPSSETIIELAHDAQTAQTATVSQAEQITARGDGTADSFAKLCEGFDDEQAEVRNATARALYKFGNDPGESFSRAMREGDAQRRRRISHSITSSGLADIALADLGKNGDQSFAAFSLLFLMAKAGEFAPLLQVVERHEDEAVRLSVVKLLGLCKGQPDVLVALRRIALRANLPPSIQTALMEAIYQLNRVQ